MEHPDNLSIKSLSSDEINKIEEFRKPKHTAVLAILFSDIVNSTYATEKLGEQVYSRLRHIHDELFTTIMCRDNAGVIFRHCWSSQRKHHAVAGVECRHSSRAKTPATEL